jgi:Lysozyme like domain
MRPDALWLLALFALGGGKPAPRRAAVVTPPMHMSLKEIRALAASVGFPDPDLAAAIAMAESSGNPFTANIVVTPAPGNLPERSFGLWQVNTLAHPEFNETQLLGAAYNAHAALLISKSGTDWSPWAGFTSGRYKQWMGDPA